MEEPMINRKTVKANKSMKAAQKEASKYYGWKFQKAPKAKINKVVSLQKVSFVSLVDERPVSQEENLDSLTADQLISIIRERELTGLSGNGFPTADKLETFARSTAKQKYLICNAVECDPGLVHDHWLLENRFEQIEKGIEVLNQCFSFERVIIATKEKVQKQCKACELFQVANRYPMGQENLLIRTVLGKIIPKGNIPAREGVLVMNVQTVLALGEMVCNHMSFQQRYLTVADLTEGRAVAVLARIGDDAATVIEKALPGIHKGSHYIGGGAMSCHKMGADEKILSTTNFIAYGEKPDFDSAQSCKRCGACVSKCPMGVGVNKIVQSLEKGKADGLEQYHPENCIGCGTCTYFCQAGKNIQGLIAKM